MSKNPLFPSEDDEPKNPAVDLIRAKVERAYSAEPDATKELAEVKQEATPSKHQRFMQELSASGKSLAEIQTAWHQYYTELPDHEKHEVWREFYSANQSTPAHALLQKQQSGATENGQVPAPTAKESGVVVAEHALPEASPKGQKASRKADPTAARELKHKIANRVSSNGKLTMKHHLQSLGFGLASGFVVLIVLLFTFFNDYIIAPFIQPSRTVSNTPIIVGDTAAANNAPPSVTVPKINIQIPIDFSLNTYDENTIENRLESGAIHYPNTVMPGQNGNASYFGHSSGNIFNNGKYKFAFTLLHDLTTGDLFYINYQGKTYVYRIFEKQIVPPTAVSVITDTRGKQATAELITCDPPGISTNRLVVWGEQISPNPTTNTAATQTAVTTAPAQIAGNGPTLWNRFVNALEFWN